jgi:hypothetical protein
VKKLSEKQKLLFLLGTVLGAGCIIKYGLPEGLLSAGAFCVIFIILFFEDEDKDVLIKEPTSHVVMIVDSNGTCIDELVKVFHYHGDILEEDNAGTWIGDVCNRNGCEGKIKSMGETCSCHFDPENCETHGIDAWLCCDTCDYSRSVGIYENTVVGFSCNCL